jgi:hypothetical protein
MRGPIDILSRRMTLLTSAALAVFQTGDFEQHLNSNAPRAPRAPRRVPFSEKVPFLISLLVPAHRGASVANAELMTFIFRS